MDSLPVSQPYMHQGVLESDISDITNNSIDITQEKLKEYIVSDKRSFEIGEHNLKPMFTAHKKNLLCNKPVISQVYS